MQAGALKSFVSFFFFWVHHLHMGRTFWHFVRGRFSFSGFRRAIKTPLLPSTMVVIMQIEMQSSERGLSIFFLAKVRTGSISIAEGRHNSARNLSRWTKAAANAANRSLDHGYYIRLQCRGYFSGAIPFPLGRNNQCGNGSTRMTAWGFTGWKSVNYIGRIFCARKRRLLLDVVANCAWRCADR